MNLASVPEQVHILECNGPFPVLDDNGRAIPFRRKRIPHHHVSRGRVLLQPTLHAQPGSCLKLICGKASVHRDSYKFESGLKWAQTNVIGSLGQFPPRPNTLEFLAFEVADLDNPVYGLFVECIRHIENLVSKNNFPTGSAIGAVVYSMMSDLTRLWLPFAPAHCLWVSSTKNSNLRGAFVRYAFIIF